MWSTVDALEAKKPIHLTLRDGSRVAHPYILSTIAEAQQGYYYTNKNYLASGHYQTILASKLGEDYCPVWYGRRLLRWEDGSQVSVDYPISPPCSKEEWIQDTEYKPVPNLPRFPIRTRYLREDEITVRDKSEQPLVIHLHGLTGGSHENYVRCAVSHLDQYGFESCILTTRGCNRTPITTPQLLDSLCIVEDVRRLVNFVIENSPRRPLFLVGFSMGASVLVSYLGKYPEEIPAQVKAAIVLSNPWDVNMTMLALELSWINRNLYSKVMASNMLRLVKNNRIKLLEDPKFREHCEKIGTRITTCTEFHDTFTAPLCGYSSSAEYFRYHSSVNLVHKIRTPMLALHARDDPVVSDVTVPYKELRSNPYIHVLASSSGGHLGWFSHHGDRWFAKVIAKYFAAYMDEVDLDVHPKSP